MIVIGILGILSSVVVLVQNFGITDDPPTVSITNPDGSTPLSGTTDIIADPTISKVAATNIPENSATITGDTNESASSNAVSEVNGAGLDSGQSNTAEATTQSGGGGTTYDWENIWETTGTTKADFLGTGFECVAGGRVAETMEVIAKPTYWPSSARGNVLEIRYPGGVGGGHYTSVDGMFPNPVTGEYFHLFFFFEAPGDSGSTLESIVPGYHGIEGVDICSGVVNSWHRRRNKPVSDSDLKFAISTRNPGGFDNTQYNMDGVLSRGTVYQMEQVVFVKDDGGGGDGIVNVSFRIWSADGQTLLKDTNDFKLSSDGVTSMLNRDNLMDADHLAALNGFNVGNNGGSNTKNGIIDRVADVRVTKGNILEWIGPIQ